MSWPPAGPARSKGPETFGVTAGHDAAPDLDVLVGGIGGIGRSLAELRAPQ